MKVLGMVLVVIGLIGLLWGGISWIDRDKIIDVGPVEVTTENHERLPVPPIIGGICLAVGAALLMAGGRPRVA